MTVFSLKLRTILIALTLIIGAGLLLLSCYNSVRAQEPAAPPPANGTEAIMPAAVINPENVAPAGQDDPLAPDRTESADKEDFFVDSRLKREISRGQQIEMLKEILNNPSDTGDFKKEALAQLLSLSNNAAKETKLESLIKAVGFKDNLVCVDEKSATVVIGGKKPDLAEEMVIMETLARETGFGEQNITIITME